MTVSLRDLLARGDCVAVKQGRLIITPVSGKPVPPEWLAEHERHLIAQAGELAGIPALEYLGHSVGNYGPKLAGGATIQFRCLRTGRDWYSVFNVETTRKRTTATGRAGQPLPKGHFRVGKKSAFLRFWNSTGLAIHRLSDFHDYMGNLSGIIFTGTQGERERLEAQSTAALSLSADQLQMAARISDSRLTTSRHQPDRHQTTHPDKHPPQSHISQGAQQISSTGQSSYGNTLTRGDGYKGKPTPPELGTVEEWLADYDKTENEEQESRY